MRKERSRNQEKKEGKEVVVREGESTLYERGKHEVGGEKGGSAEGGGTREERRRC